MIAASHTARTRPTTHSLGTSTGAAPVQPYTFRLPRNGQTDPYFGGSRTFWNQRVLPNKSNGGRPPVKSIVEKQPGSKRGIRFILFESAKSYFKRLAENQAPGRPEED